MAYRLWLPGDPEPEVAGSEPQTSPAVAVVAPTTEPLTAHEIFLTKVAPAFHAMTKRLEPVLADRWLGASGRIRQHAPAVYDAINLAEENADEMARRFMTGTATEAQFLAAVADYETAWRRGAAVVELLDRGTTS